MCLSSLENNIILLSSEPLDGVVLL